MPNAYFRDCIVNINRLFTDGYITQPEFGNLLRTDKHVVQKVANQKEVAIILLKPIMQALHIIHSNNLTFFLEQSLANTNQPIRRFFFDIQMLHQKGAERPKESQIIVACAWRIFPFNIDIVQKTNTESPVELINIPYRHPLIIVPFFHYASKTDIIVVR